MTIKVAAALGWPASQDKAAPGLGWPTTKPKDSQQISEPPGVSDQVEPSTGPVLTDSPASHETNSEAAPVLTESSTDQVEPLADVSRETDVAQRTAYGARQDRIGYPATVSRETEPDLPVEADPAVDQAATTEVDVPHRVLTAADLATGTTATFDSSTPLARVAESSLTVSNSLSVKRELPKPAETRVLIVANQKGGVGKTTTAVNVAAAMAQHGLRVLVVDLDPQGNASTALSIEHSEGTPGTYQVLVEGTPMAKVVAECLEIPGLYAIPATIDLAGAEIDLVSLVARENRLRKALESFLTESDDAGERFDYVFIDCPPSLGLLTVNALTAGREMLIPIQCEYYALEGLTQLLRTIDQIREHLNPDLGLGVIMLTMYDARTRLAAGVAQEVRTHFGDVVLRTAIPRSVRISEAPSYGQTVLTYDPGSPGALSYLEAAKEIAEQARTNEGDSPS